MNWAWKNLTSSMVTIRDMGTKFAKRSIQVPNLVKLSLTIASVKLLVSVISVLKRARYWCWVLPMRRVQSWLKVAPMRQMKI